MPNFPEDLRFTKQHEWARLEEGMVRVGISLFAAEQIGDVTTIDLPEPGTSLDASSHFGDIETVTGVSELCLPVSGDIIEVNTALESSPELINEAPYGEGWMVLIRPSDLSELRRLMDSDAYEEYIGDID